MDVGSGLWSEADELGRGNLNFNAGGSKISERQNVNHLFIISRLINQFQYKSSCCYKTSKRFEPITNKYEQMALRKLGPKTNSNQKQIRTKNKFGPIFFC